MYRSHAVVDLTAIKHNLRVISGKLPKETGIMAVVKANGYGHGVLPVSRAAAEAGAKGLAVADVCEGAELRQGGFTMPILVLGGMLPELAEDAVRHDLALAVGSADMIAALEAAAIKLGKQAAAHIKVETGMNRLGARPGAELAALLDCMKSAPHVSVEGLFSHFAVSEIADKTFTLRQVEEFRRAVAQVHAAGYRPTLHIGNSGAALECPFAYFDLVRVGIAMYGLHPAGAAGDSGLRPALTWKTNIVHVKTVHEGDTVSYGRMWTAPGDRLIATLPVGYADGYRRVLGNRADVLIRGKRAPIVGRVCMDHMMADVTDIDGAQTGDEAVLIGSQGRECVSADEIAALTDTINYEVVTAIGNRVKRVYIDG